MVRPGRRRDNQVLSESERWDLENQNILQLIFLMRPRFAVYPDVQNCIP